MSNTTFALRERSGHIGFTYFGNILVSILYYFCETKRVEQNNRIFIMPVSVDGLCVDHTRYSMVWIYLDIPVNTYK